MTKKLIYAAALLLSAFQVNATQFTDLSPEFNIAKGLAPIDQHQTISVLEPFNGEFRILGSKEYSHDEQAKFSPIDYAVTRGLFKWQNHRFLLNMPLN